MVMTKRNIQLLRSGAIVLMKKTNGLSQCCTAFTLCPAVGATLCSGGEENFKTNVTGQLKEL